MTHAQAKSELMQIYMSLSEEKKKAIDVAIEALEQEPNTVIATGDGADYKIKALQADGEKSFKMRDATPEEQEAIDKYIKSISKPTGVNFGALEQEPCEDAISRQEVLDVVNNPLNIRLDEIIKQLPPVKPQEPKTGHWKRISMDKYSEHAKYWYRCDRCGKDNLGDTDWCPNCGAKMD